MNNIMYILSGGIEWKTNTVLYTHTPVDKFIASIKKIKNDILIIHNKRI